MPRWVDADRVTFRYGLGEEFINVLRVLHKIGLDRTDPRTGRQRRDVTARCGRCVPPRSGRARREDVRQDLRRVVGHRHQ